MWGKIIIPMYRLWLHGLYGLYGPRYPLSPKRLINLISLSLSLSLSLSDQNIEWETTHLHRILDELQCSMGLYIDGLLQERRNSSALELCLSCTDPLIYVTNENFKCISKTTDSPLYNLYDRQIPAVMASKESVYLTNQHIETEKNGRRFADDTFKRIFLNENIRISIKISPKFVPKGAINNIPTLVQEMAWRRPGDKPLSEPMMVSLLTHICVTWPQWVKA